MKEKEIIEYLRKGGQLDDDKLEKVFNIHAGTSKDDDSVTIKQLLLKCGFVTEEKIGEVEKAIGEKRKGKVSVIDDTGISTKYVILKKLGEGDLDSVYKAYDLISRRYVALKVYEKVSREEAERLKSELEMVQNLDHSNIVSIYEVVKEGGKLYVATQYVEGNTLDKMRANLTRVNILRAPNKTRV